MNIVYDLWFNREYGDREDTEIHLGIFASRGDAEAAIAVLKDKPGFQDFPKGFEIRESTLNHFAWESGFISIVGKPPKDAIASVTDVPAFVEGYLPGGPKFDGVHFAGSHKKTWCPQ